MEIEEAEKIFSSLAEKNRLKALKVMKEKQVGCGKPDECDFEECCDVSEIAKELEVSISTSSHHLKELRNAGLIEVSKNGKNSYCKINKDKLDEVRQFLKNFSG